MNALIAIDEKLLDRVRAAEAERDHVRLDWLWVCARNERLDAEIQRLREENTRLRGLARRAASAIAECVRYPIGKLARVLGQLEEAGRGEQ